MRLKTVSFPIEDKTRWQTKLAEFRDDLRGLDASAIIKKHIIDGESMVLDGPIHRDLISRVAKEFDADAGEVILVGSAKLCFSIKPSRRYEFFSNSSDIDLTVISKFLFKNVWRETFDYERSGANWQRKAEFHDYLVRGWI